MKSFGIGFLMKELKIKPTDLANYIYVDRSLISKWKAGKRNMDPKADYFNKILDFFIAKNKEVDNKILEGIFSTDDTIAEEDMKTLIKNFILNKETSSPFKRYIKNDNSYSFIASIVLYEGDEAQKNAILNFLEEAQYEPPSKLTFVYDENLNIICENKEFREKYLNRILSLLNAGFTLDILYSSFSSTTLFIYFSCLIFHNNCSIYEFTANFAHRKFSLHILENKLALRGIHESKQIFSNTNGKSESCNISTLFSDELSINLYTKMSEHIKQQSVPLFTSVDEDYIFMQESKVAKRIKTDNSYSKYHTLYFFNSTPSHFLMSEELFLELLNQTLKCKKQIEAYYNKYKERRDILLWELDNWDKIHFYSLSLLKKLANQDYVELSYENTVLDVKLRLNKSQFRRFLNDIADILDAHHNFHICLNDNVTIHSMSSAFFLCISNKSFFAFDVASPTQYRISNNLSFINSVTTMFEHIYLYSHKELTDNKIVAEILRKL